jgi:hypothetical protein
MEAPPLERRLAAVLAADVEGYSRLMHDDEEATLATLSARRTVIDELILRHRGRIANTAGDSVLAEFVSVLDAVRCVVENCLRKILANPTSLAPFAGRRIRPRPAGLPSATPHDRGPPAQAGCRMRRAGDVSAFGGDAADEVLGW